MNAYDFDETIYDGDATFDYFLHCLRRHRAVWLYAPRLIGPALLFLLGRMDKTAWKQRFFGFLRCVPDVELDVLLFWDRSAHKIKPFYQSQKKPDDIIISASPEFLLRPLLTRIGVSNLIASRVDPRTGRFDGANCWGEEKVRRFRELYPDGRIDDFYSDSQSDAPLARIAGRAFLVSGNRIREWRR